MKSMYKTPILMAILSAILFGAATPASKLLLGTLTPFQLAGLLYLGAAAAVAPAALKGGGFALPQRVDHQNQIRLLGAVLFGGILAPVALLFGLQALKVHSNGGSMSFDRCGGGGRARSNHKRRGYGR